MRWHEEVNSFLLGLVLGRILERKREYWALMPLSLILELGLMIVRYKCDFFLYFVGLA